MPRRIELDGTVHEFPDDFTDSDIQKALGGGRSPLAAPSAPSDNGLKQGLLAAIPAVTGGIGGVLGGAAGAAAGGIGAIPGGAAGAALGGAAGEAIRQGVSGMLGEATPKDLKQAATQTAVEGGKQAMWELGGRWVAAGGRLAGKSMMAAMLRRAGDKAPQLAETMLDEGIAATRNGVRKLTKKLGESAGNTLALARQAGQGGAAFHPLDVLAGVPAMQQQAQGKALVTPTVRRLNQLSAQFLRDHRGPLTPDVLLKIRQDADAVARPIYRMIERGERVPPLGKALAEWHKAVADRARELLHSIPEIAESDARTSKLIVLKDALRPTVSRAIPLAARLGAPGAGAAAGALTGSTPAERAQRSAAGALIGAGLTSPNMVSMGALLMASPMFQNVVRQIPRGADATVRLVESK